MSDTSAFQPSVPPRIPGPNPEAANLPLGDGFEERVPVANFIIAVEAILRQPRRIIHQLRQEGQAGLVARLLLIALVCSLVYGVVVGTFSRTEPLFQLWTAPLKTALALLVSALICLPSLYVFSCLSGSQARIMEVFGLLAGLLALTTVLLIGFAPVAWVFSESTKSVPAIGALHFLFSFIAISFGLRFLFAGFTYLSVSSKTGLKVWVAIFVLVTLQMTTALRPMVGTSRTFFPPEKKFFINHWSECLER